jgi:uncharacterized protein (DUF1501 family)
MAITRRTFLRGAAAATAAGALPHPLFRAMLGPGNAWATPPDRILVLVQLEGGNDGLNMVVPADGPQRTLYEARRPTLQIPAGSLLPVADDPVTGDALGLHPACDGLKALYDAGRVAIVNGVGYPNQSLSHFRSEDIWYGGLPSTGTFTTGWFGRVLDATQPAGALVTLDADGTLWPGFTSESANVLVLKRLSEFVLPDDALYPDGAAKQATLGTLYATEATATGLVGRIAATGDVLLGKIDDYAAVDTTWPSNLNAVPGGPAARLKQVASVIRHDYVLGAPSPTGARFFHVRLGGFDTHTRQGGVTGRQADLLTQVFDAIRAFFDDLVATNLADDVLLVVFSEFGRRVAENGGAATAGTDHGAAAPVVVVGGNCVGGVHGRVPPLDQALLDQGKNLAFHTDFRSVYATIIQKWLGADPVPVLGGAFPMQAFLP